MITDNWRASAAIAFSTARMHRVSTQITGK